MTWPETSGSSPRGDAPIVKFSLGRTTRHPSFQGDTTDLINCAIILAGGKGTRLAAIHGDIPKALVPVGGKPVLGHQLELLANHGFDDVRIFAGHLAEQIEDYVSRNAPNGMAVQLEIESEPLGTAGCVINALDSLPDQFAVLYGDTMMAVNLRRMADHHLEQGADITALVHPNDHPHDSDLVETDEGSWITALHPYPHPEDACFRNLVSAALYVVRREALRALAGVPCKRDFAKDVFPLLLDSNSRLLAYHSNEYIKDMGTPERLEKVNRAWEFGTIQSIASGRLQPAIFFDRDGTLNEWNGYVRRPEDLHLIEGAPEALRRLRESGYRLIVLTNQPVIARGEATEADLAAIHRKLEWELGLQGAFVDAIYYCPHHPDSGFEGERPELKRDCDCRKPGTAMLQQAAEDHHLDLSRSWMIGDSTRDIEMANRAGIHSVLLGTGEAGNDGSFPDSRTTLRARNLGEAVDAFRNSIS